MKELKIYKAIITSKDGIKSKSEVVSDSYENAKKLFENNHRGYKVKLLKQTRKNIYS